MKFFYTLILTFLIPFSSISQVPSFRTDVYDSASTTGYYFLATSSNLMILDRYGSMVYYKPGKQLSNFMLQPNGTMTYNAVSKFFLMDSTFNITDSVACKNVAVTNYHDVRILANGHFLMIGTDSARMDLSGYPYWKEKFVNDTANVKYTVIQEQDAKKNVVFEWCAKDRYAIDDVDTFFLPWFPLFDWTHPDAVEMDRDGNILLSNRNLNEITKINHSDGSIMWRLGGKQNEFKFINFSVPFYGQSDIRRIDNGHITLFDNGEHTIPHAARALEFDLDEVKKTATLVWSYTYRSDMSSKGQGNVQRLNNSNTLVSFGRVSDDVCFVVVNFAGTKVLQMDGIKVDRAYNYASLPFHLHRPNIACYDSLGVTYLDAGAGYKSYQWSSGDTTRIIPVSKQGIYYVFVPYGQGGFIASEKFNVADIYHPCINKASYGRDRKPRK